MRYINLLLVIGIVLFTTLFLSCTSIRNPNTSSDDLVKLARSNELRNLYDASIAAVRNPNTSSDDLVKLARSNELRNLYDASKVFGELVQHPNITPEALSEVVWYVAGLPTKKISMDTEVFWINPAYTCMAFASSCKALPEDLAKLATMIANDINLGDFDDMVFVLEEIGRNPNTPLETLKMLAKHKHFRSRFGVAENQNLPPYLFQEMAEDELWAIRSSIAGRSETPPEIRVNLARDEHWFVRSQIARSETSPTVLIEMADDWDENVRFEVFKNKNTPHEVRIELEKNKKELSTEVRMFLESVLESVTTRRSHSSSLLIKVDDDEKKVRRHDELTLYLPPKHYSTLFPSAVPLIIDAADLSPFSFIVLGGYDLFACRRPVKKSKSLTAIKNDVWEAIERIHPKIIDIKSAPFTKTALIAAIEATLGIGPVQDVTLNPGGYFSLRE